MSDRRLRIFEGNMEHALKSWHGHGGRENLEPAIVEVPFEDVLRSEGRDPDTLAKVQELYLHWQELDCAADALDHKAGVPEYCRQAARRRAEEFRAMHEDEFSWLADLESETTVDDYDWNQRLVGVRTVFRWVLAEGAHPLKIMKRLYAVGRGLGIAPFTQLTMEEQGHMFSEKKASVSWRMKVLSGVLSLRGMAARRLPGQKSPHSKAAYSVAQQGNGNRANGHRNKVRQASFLRSLHVPKSKPTSS